MAGPYFVCPLVRCWTSELFALRALVNNAAVNTCAVVFCGRKFSLLLTIYLGAELTGHRETQFLTF